MCVCVCVLVEAKKCGLGQWWSARERGDLRCFSPAFSVVDVCMFQ